MLIDFYSYLEKKYDKDMKFHANKFSYLAISTHLYSNKSLRTLKH